MLLTDQGKVSFSKVGGRLAAVKRQTLCARGGGLPVTPRNRLAARAPRPRNPSPLSKLVIDYPPCVSVCVCGG
ncbi:hypothetical protein EON66_12350 [archaeon]|nr:MAG: hypothetical protein EON66_12350 [archaeon]